MKLQADTKLYEQIPHTTDSAPYSIHGTELPVGAEPALYLHWHNEMEFLLLTEGELLFQIEDKLFSMQAGDAVFIPSGTLHSAKNTGTTSISFHALVFSPEFLISSFDTPAYNTYVLPTLHNNLQYAIVLKHTQNSWHKKILDFLHELFFSEAKEELFIRGQLLLLWYIFYQNHIQKTDAENVSQKTTALYLSAQLEPAIHYIKTHYQQPLTLDQLAATVHLSEGQFCRTFKHLTGMTPFQYLVRCRILQSCHDLSSTNKKITDIATTHGFNNISYYNRAFLKVMNITPSEYRKQLIPQLTSLSQS